MTTNMLDTNMIISWNPPNNNDNTNTNNPSTDFYHYQHCSPKFPSPDPGNLSPSPILSDHHQHHQFELPNFSLSQSNHQNMSNPVGSFVGASLTSSSSSSSSSVSCDSNSNDSTNFLRQFYHDTSPIGNVTLTHGDNFSLLPSIPNIVMSERNVCYPAGQLNDEFHDISDSADQCSNFSVGYLIGHSSMPSSSSSSSSTSLLSASRCVVMQTEQNAIIMPSVCSSTTTGTVNYLNNSLPHPSDQQHHPRSLSSQLNFSNDPIDYEFV
ncbi:unnamed protein product [Heterobilharzia americana]|nr:unnamed protein product [Heterobilharzia americana]